MKTLIYLLRQSLKAHITLICFFSMPYIAFAIEPIATIGQPRPKEHAFLNNGTILRVVSSHIQVVDANTGEVIDRFGNKDYFSKVVFSPDGTHLAIFNSFGYPQKTKVQIWNINALERIATWEIEGGIDVAAFSPTQPLLAISVDDEIHLWNWHTGELVGTMEGERRHQDVVYSTDGKLLLVASKRPDIELWNVETRELMGHIEGHVGSWVNGVAVSPNGKYIVSYDSQPGSVYLWSIESRQLLWKAQIGFTRITDLAFSPNSQHLYVTTNMVGWSRSGTDPWEGWDVKVRVWDVNSGQQIDMFETEFKGLKTITVSPDGKKALLLYVDGEILWDIENKQMHQMWTDFIAEWPYSGYNDVALSPDGKTVIAISSYFIKSWDATSQQMRLLVSAEDYEFNTVTISPDSQKFAVGKEPFVEIRDIQTGKIETQFPHYFRLPEKVTFSSSGRLLAVVDHWGKMAILNVESPEKEQQLTTPMNLTLPGGTYQIGFSENEEYVASFGKTRIDNNSYHPWILLWKREADTYVFQYAWEGTFDSSPAFMTDTDGSTVLAGNGKNGIHIWKLLPDKPQLLTTLNTEGPVQFSPGGRYFFANFYSTQDDYFQIWDWRTSRPIKHPFSIPSYVSLSQDGSVLMSRDYDGTGQYLIYDIKKLISFLPYPVEPKGKQFVTLGQIKKNQLLQNFPNPFNPETWIPFQLADKNDVTIRIYTPTGKLVRSLSPGTMPAGDYSSQSQAVYWDGRNDKGETVSSGVYLYTIDAGDFSATRKMLIRK
ncbi:MAG: T9SS type A sorting domain-containing protein [Candidatus Poribacteria bacterium]|nr:T9SS type A sorting domain-containing protein [Candidatus Poribacteria bacterium]